MTAVSERDLRAPKFFPCTVAGESELRPSLRQQSQQAWPIRPGCYRERVVDITGASHVPPPKDAVPACMETLFELLRNEPNAWVRAVLGHFTFVFIHPYSDGNGRLGRFLMNLMLASGGYPWTVIDVERRFGYMAAFESASAQQDIEPFARFVADEIPCYHRGERFSVDWRWIPFSRRVVITTSSIIRRASP